MGDKKGTEDSAMFNNYSGGVKTNRDPWAYNSSRAMLLKKMKDMIELYNHEVARANQEFSGKERQDWAVVGQAVNSNPNLISWSSGLIADFCRQRLAVFSNDRSIGSLYRPFFKQWLYYDQMLNDRTGQMPHIFPENNLPNRIICISGVGARQATALMTDTILCYDGLEKSQCFPLYLYEAPADDSLFAAQSKYERRDAITDAGLAHFQSAYPGEKIKKEDLFYYVYGLLHSPEYRERYADNLSKELPRILRVQTAADFRAFVAAGRALGDLHVNYEKAKRYPLKRITAKSARKDVPEFWRVTKMRYASKEDKSAIVYNDFLTLAEIPREAQEYIVNGKSALDWVVERYCVKTDKDSGIVNDANLWATETAGNPAYIVELIERVVTVSLDTMKIVRGLPALTIHELDAGEPAAKPGPMSEDDIGRLNRLHERLGDKVSGPLLDQVLP